MPFLMKWPAKIPPGLMYSQPVAHVDMFATAAAAAGSAADWSAIDGIDLLPFLSQHTLSDNTDISNVQYLKPPHDTLYWRSGHYKAIHSGRWKLQLSELPERVWLFDLHNDPTEKNNLSTNQSYSDTLADMMSLMKREDEKQSKPLWPALSATYISIDKTEEEHQALEDEYVLWEN